MRNYITAPMLFNTGFLSNDSALRIKQGLPQQELAGDCFSSFPSKLYGVKIRTEGDCLKNMYTIKFPEVSYGYGNIPKDCPCAKYVQPA